MLTTHVYGTKEVGKSITDVHHKTGIHMMKWISQTLTNGISSRKKSKSGWCADGRWRVEVGEDHALVSKRIQMLRINGSLLIETNISITEVIGQNENYIRFVLNRNHIYDLLNIEWSVVKIGTNQPLM